MWEFVLCRTFSAVSQKFLRVFSNLDEKSLSSTTLIQIFLVFRLLVKHM